MAGSNPDFRLLCDPGSSLNLSEPQHRHRESGSMRHSACRKGSAGLLSRSLAFPRGLLRGAGHGLVPGESLSLAHDPAPTTRGRAASPGRETACVLFRLLCVGAQPWPPRKCREGVSAQGSPPQQPGPGTLSVSPSPGWVVSNQTKEEKNEQVWTAE